VWGIQKTILMIVAVVMGQSIMVADKKWLFGDPIVEKTICKQLKKPNVIRWFLGQEDNKRPSI